MKSGNMDFVGIFGGAELVTRCTVVPAQRHVVRLHVFPQPGHGGTGTYIFDEKGWGFADLLGSLTGQSHQILDYILGSGNLN
jgi:hypothetical protein